MGVKVGPQTFQRPVSWCVGRLKLHIRAYINDTLVGTRTTFLHSGEVRWPHLAYRPTLSGTWEGSRGARVV